MSDSTTPLVTVITPAYNVAKYIGETVDSVLGQTLGDFEYLVMDDGSADDTLAVVREHADGDPRVRPVAGPHQGVVRTRNSALDLARGKYVAFLDGDDRWHPRFLERMVALIESLPPDVGLVFCRSRTILESGTPINYLWQRAGRYDFDDFLVQNNPARTGSSLLIRKSCFDEVGGFDETVYVDDLEMWLRIAERSTTPGLWGSGRFLVDRRRRSGSLTSDRAGVVWSLVQLLDAQTPRLRRLPAGLAYVRPALVALKDGWDDGMSEKLVLTAKEAGTGALLGSFAGWQFLVWSGLPPAGQRALRATRRRAWRTVERAARLAIRETSRQEAQAS
jgi:glycosyltransferase involved in cell wall biosynthesis